jgi:hypothetical protein
MKFFLSRLGFYRRCYEVFPVVTAYIASVFCIQRRKQCIICLGHKTIGNPRVRAQFCISQCSHEHTIILPTLKLRTILTVRQDDTAGTTSAGLIAQDFSDCAECYCSTDWSEILCHCSTDWSGYIPTPAVHVRSLDARPVNSDVFLFPVTRTIDQV